MHRKLPELAPKGQLFGATPKQALGCNLPTHTPPTSFHPLRGIQINWEFQISLQFFSVPAMSPQRTTAAFALLLVAAGCCASASDAAGAGARALLQEPMRAVDHVAPTAERGEVPDHAAIQPAGNPPGLQGSLGLAGQLSLVLPAVCSTFCKKPLGPPHSPSIPRRFLLPPPTLRWPILIPCSQKARGPAVYCLAHAVCCLAHAVCCLTHAVYCLAHAAEYSTLVPAVLEVPSSCRPKFTCPGEVASWLAGRQRAPL